MCLCTLKRINRPSTCIQFYYGSAFANLQVFAVFFSVLSHIVSE